jgi:predicted O-methyltransferase YrrM
MGTVWLLDNLLTHTDSTLIDIDTFSSDGDLAGANFDTVKELYYHNLSECPNAHKHKILIGKSENILPTLEENSFDLIYVDGSHLKKDVAIDARLSFKLCKPGGLIFFDDYDWGTNDKNVSREFLPHDAIDEFMEEYKGKFRVIDIHYQVIIEKL